MCAPLSQVPGKVYNLRFCEHHEQTKSWGYTLSNNKYKVLQKLIVTLVIFFHKNHYLKTITTTRHEIQWALTKKLDGLDFGDGIIVLPQAQN